MKRANGENGTEPTSLSSEAAQAGGLAGALGVYWPLWPCIMGFACIRVGAAFTLGGLYVGTDKGVFTDGPNVVTLLVFLVVGAVMFRTRAHVRKPWVNRVLFAAVAVQALAVLSMVVLAAAGLYTPLARFSLLALVSLGSTVATLYWLRRMRGASMVTASVMILVSLGVSELAIFALSFIPSQEVRCLVSSAFALGQLPCARWARSETSAFRISAAPSTSDHFAYVQQGFASPRFLSACAAGIVALSLVVGFLRGYPHGEPVALSFEGRVLAFVLTEAVLFGLLAAVLRGKGDAMTVGVWVIMQLLAAVALVLYCAFHGNLSYGAALVTTLNSVMSAFVWHSIIAFMTYGTRDPFYYGIVVWCLWIGARTIGRFVPFALGVGYASDSHLVGTIVSLTLLISAQFVFVKLIEVAAFSAREELRAEHAAAPDGSSGDAAVARAAASDAAPRTFDRILGLEGDSGLKDVREALMCHNAQAMGRQFLLSEREVEVLSLYASGMTQKRVAEKLHISTTTAHTHITRIYAKTGLHSRQEILDYMHEYVEGAASAQ